MVLLLTIISLASGIIGAYFVYKVKREVSRLGLIFFFLIGSIPFVGTLGLGLAYLLYLYEEGQFDYIINFFTEDIKD